MKRFLLSIIILFLLFVPLVHATSQQAYQDYVFQGDQYRKAYSEFTIAKNEYEKFKSLASETIALDKTKQMLTTRDSYVRSYLLLLNEKLVENPGLSSSARNLSVSLLTTEGSFLESHSALVSAVGSISEAVTVSSQFESRYESFIGIIEQTRTTLMLGNLNSLAITYDSTVAMAQNLITSYRESLPATKRATIDRWLLEIQNKRGLYEQKIDIITNKNKELPESDAHEVQRQSVEIGEEVAAARQYLADGASFLKELVAALKYEN